MKSLSFRKDLIGVQDELLRFAYKLTTDREEANDLLQETSLKALDNEDKYTPDTNFKGWMYTIMRNIFINNYRKVVRDQTFVDQTENLYHLNPVSYTHLLTGFSGSPVNFSTISFSNSRLCSGLTFIICCCIRSVSLFSGPQPVC